MCIILVDSFALVARDDVMNKNNGQAYLFFQAVHVYSYEGVSLCAELNGDSWNKSRCEASEETALIWLLEWRKDSNVGERKSETQRNKKR